MSPSTDRPQPTPPLGEGFHEPSVDPWKGLRGVMAGTLVMEAIVIGLVLTVISRVDAGAHFQTWKVVYVAALAVAMCVASGMQRRPFALALDLVLAGLAVLGFVVHPSMGICGLMFAAVWAYILWLRRDLQQRIDRGFLASQYD